MLGWLHKLLSSRASLSRQYEQESKVTSDSLTSVGSSTALFASSSGSSSSSQHRSSRSALTSPQRWNRRYDVLLCHSSVHTDTELAVRLVSSLEASPHSLRCFLWERDACPGGALATELCQAIQNSHLRALLITPHFVQDSWCKYMMHQALAEMPMSRRIIPLVQNLLPAEYPQELKFCWYLDLSKDPNHCSALINNVLKSLEALLENEQTLVCNLGSSGNGLSGQGSSQEETSEDVQMSKHDPKESLVSAGCAKEESGELH